MYPFFEYNICSENGSGGDHLRTLLVHYSDDELISELCAKSSSDHTDVLELHELSGQTPFGRRLSALRGGYTRLRNYEDVHLDAYDTVVLATNEWFGGVYPAMNTFIRENDLRFKDVVCLVFGEGRGAKKAGDALRNRVSLSGGTPRCVVTVPVKGLKQDEEDLLFYLRHRIRV